MSVGRANQRAPTTSNIPEKAPTTAMIVVVSFGFSSTHLAIVVMSGASAD